MGFHPPSMYHPWPRTNRQENRSFRNRGNAQGRECKTDPNREDANLSSLVTPPNIIYQHTDPPYHNQPMGGRGCQGGRRQGRHGGTGNMQTIHTNKINRFQNLHYCFTCGYNVDHPGKTCPVSDAAYNMNNIPRDEAHMYANQGAMMVAQQKYFTDGTSATMGCIIANSIRKVQFVMQRHQEFTRNHQ